MGADKDLLLGAGFERDFARQYFQVFDARVGVERRRHPLGDPARHDFVFRRAHAETPPAAVRNGERGLEQD